MYKLFETSFEYSKSEFYDLVLQILPPWKVSTWNFFELWTIQNFKTPPPPFFARDIRIRIFAKYLALIFDPLHNFLNMLSMCKKVKLSKDCCLPHQSTEMSRRLLWCLDWRVSVLFCFAVGSLRLSRRSYCNKFQCYFMPASKVLWCLVVSRSSVQLWVE